jgi:hypothetical protein
MVQVTMPVEVLTGSAPQPGKLCKLTLPPFGTGLTLAVSVTGWPTHTVRADRVTVVVVLVVAKKNVTCCTASGATPFDAVTVTV